MNKRKMYISLIIIILVGIAIPICCYIVDSNDGIINVIVAIITIISGACTILMLVMAICAFDKFGIGQKSFSYQYESVMKLYENLSRLYFTVVCSKSGLYFDANGNMKDFNMEGHIILLINKEMQNMKFDKLYLDLPIAFQETFLHSLKCIVRDVPLTSIPKSIKEKLVPSFLSKMTVPVESDKQYAMVVGESFDEIFKSENGSFRTFHFGGMTVKDFIMNYEVLKQSIFDWLQLNGAEMSNIDINCTFYENSIDQN